MERQPDIRRLTAFSDRDDRDESPFFVGRRDELAWLQRRADLVLADWRNGGAVGGRTTLITGCPGMGKTALLRQFATRVSEANGPGSPLIPVEMSATFLRSSDDIVAKLLRAIGEPSSRWAKLGVAIGTDTAKRLKMVETLDAAKTAWRGRADKMPGICLLVDEIQTVGEKNRDALHDLHLGTLELPILPVYAGLNDSLGALRNCGISRLGSKARVNLQPLTACEAREAVESMMVEYAVAGSATDKEAWSKAIADASSGFPQHLHTGLAAAARVLAENEGVATATGLTTALRQAAMAREAYYSDRLSAEVKRHGKALVDLIGRVAGANEPMLPDDLYAHAYRAMQERGSFRRPSKNDAVDFVDRLVHDGVLQEAANAQGYVVPIPSMRTWILDNYAGAIGHPDAPRSKAHRIDPARDG